SAAPWHALPGALSRRYGPVPDHLSHEHSGGNLAAASPTTLPDYLMRSAQVQSPPAMVRRLRNTAGEPFVWFTAMGLTIGLGMVVCLVGLIIVAGLDAFWPKRVAQIELREGSHAGIRNAPRLGGAVVKVQQKATPGE